MRFGQDKMGLMSEESGMTLLEIIISITLLLVMTISTSSLLTNGIDMRLELSQRSKVNHRLAIAMQRITDDLQHAFLLNFKRQEYLDYVTTRATKSLFMVRPWENNSELRLTTLTHKPRVASAHESDQTFVVYRIEKDKDNQRPHLFRGETPMIPMNFEDDVPMVVLAKNIKALRISPWNGEKWIEEWNTGRADWRDSLPRMVKVEVDAYTNELPDETSQYAEGDPITTLRTVVMIPRAVDTKEVKDRSKTLKWDH
ncbi:type II secretion system GspH family protein [Oligoflexus tunisiensis]|uniref:type II secretion system GspH family protein n=1 Tax=Oligoflexus tunisiensis TaxID=708132 RepID=UPI00114D38EF|nr:type II secretion system GspH family protein [Oligoflexus tunisiensis]